MSCWNSVVESHVFVIEGMTVGQFCCLVAEVPWVSRICEDGPCKDF